MKCQIAVDGKRLAWCAQHDEKTLKPAPLWGRFYEIGTNCPIFCGRDGVIKYSITEIEYERRNGYSWYTNNPRDLLEDYAEWIKK